MPDRPDGDPAGCVAGRSSDTEFDDRRSYVERRGGVDAEDARDGIDEPVQPADGPRNALRVRGASADGILDELLRERPERIPAGAPADVGAILKTVGATLVSTVGGASGPLYGTAFLRAGMALAGKTALEPDDIEDGLKAALEGIKARGKAQAGEKTMIDALEPAVAAFSAALAAGKDKRAALAATADAAEEGMRATIPLLATKGRASYLGERSRDHQDPGATSAAMILRAAADQE